MSTELYPWSLTKRLLQNWRLLAEGQYPRNPDQLEGYRGQQHAESAPFEQAIIACADLHLAVRRLPESVRRHVLQRYWNQERPASDSPRPKVLVDVVWRELNGLPAEGG